MADPPAEKKKGFGEKLKGVGKAIGRGLKKVPGIAYRDVVKPYGAHMRDKFIEPIDITHLADPIGRLPIGMGRKVKGKGGISDLAGPIQPLPIGMGRKATPDPKRRRAARGRTTAYDPSFTGKSAVERLAETAPKKTPTPKKEPKKEPRTQSEGRKTKSTDLTAFAGAGDVVTVIGELPKDKKRTPRRAKKGPARKFSPKRTRETLKKAAEKRREQMAAVPAPDTTAQEVARMMTEQDIAREAQRTETELKGGRKPTREKARYRYRTRGLKRSEGRGR